MIITSSGKSGRKSKILEAASMTVLPVLNM
jgi:hypothetical protein